MISSFGVEMVRGSLGECCRQESDRTGGPGKALPTNRPDTLT